jgi:hypothetical protein
MWQAADEMLAVSHKYPASGTLGQGEHGQRAAHVPLPYTTPRAGEEERLGGPRGVSEGREAHTAT